MTTWDMFVTSDAWKRLTEQQQVFVRVMIATGDSKEAVRVAYPNANAHSQIVMANQVEQSTRVRAAMDFWGGPVKRMRERLDDLAAENQQLKTRIANAAREAATIAEYASCLSMTAPEPRQLADNLWSNLWHQIETRYEDQLVAA